MCWNKVMLSKVPSNRQLQIGLESTLSFTITFFDQRKLNTITHSGACRCNKMESTSYKHKGTEIVLCAFLLHRLKLIMKNVNSLSSEGCVCHLLSQYRYTLTIRKKQSWLTMVVSRQKRKSLARDANEKTSLCEVMFSA